MMEDVFSKVWAQIKWEEDEVNQPSSKSQQIRYHEAHNEEMSLAEIE